MDFYITANAQYGDLTNIKNLIFDERITKWQRLSTIGEENKIKSIIASVILRLYEKKLPRFDYGVCIVGNAFKNSKYYGKTQSRWIKERVRWTKRFYLLSTNFGPYSDPRWINDNYVMFKKMKDVCFRDLESYHLFEKLENVRFAPDAIISIGKKENKSVEKHLIVSVIDCLFSVRPEYLNKSAANYERLIVNTVNEYTKMGYKVTILNSNTVQDLPASERILSSCINKECIEIFNYDGNITDVMALYENTSAVIGTRLHTIILAWLFDIPVVPIVYDIKVKNLLNSYKYSARFFEIEKLSGISAKDVIEALNKYSYQLPAKLILDANKQFERLDMELL